MVSIIYHPINPYALSSYAPLLLQFTKKIPSETKGSPTMREKVNSSSRKRVPKRTPKMGVKKVKAESLLTE